MNLTAADKVGSKLPVTRSQLTIVMVALGVGLMIAGCDIHRKRSHVDDEKRRVKKDPENDGGA